MKRARTDRGNVGATPTKRNKWQAEQDDDDSDDINDADLENLEMPPSSDDERNDEEENGIIDEDQRRTGDQHLKNKEDVAAHAPRGKSPLSGSSTGMPSLNINSKPLPVAGPTVKASSSTSSPNLHATTSTSPENTAKPKISEAPDDPDKSSSKNNNDEEYLVESFIRFGIQFGPRLRHDLVVETQVLCRLPKKLKVAGISDTLIAFEELKDEVQIERERQKRQESSLKETETFAGVEGETAKGQLLGRDGCAFQVPEPKQWPAIEKILGHTVDAEEAGTVYLLTDCDERLYLSMKAPLSELLSPTFDHPLVLVGTSGGTSLNSGDRSSIKGLSTGTSTFSPLKLLGRVLAPSGDVSLTEEEDPRTAIQNLLILERPEFCPEPFEVEVLLDLGRMQEKSEKIQDKKDLIAMILSEFDAASPSNNAGASSNKRRRAPHFIASKAFAGAKDKMLFKNGPLGIGYYEDLVRKRIYNPEDEDADDEEEGEEHATKAGKSTRTEVTTSNGNSRTTSSSAKYAIDLEGNKNGANRNLPSSSSPTFVQEEGKDVNIGVKSDDRYFIERDLHARTLDSMDAVDFFLSAREVEVVSLKVQEYTTDRHERVKALSKALADLRNDLTGFEETLLQRRKADGEVDACASSTGASAGTRGPEPSKGAANGGGSKLFQKYQDDDGPDELAWDEAAAEKTEAARRRRERDDAVLGTLSWNLERVKAIERVFKKLN
ncbi:unnamed protein product [Amoebophrya sp. A25]|nr:unnamed protein product [Amoebophrya sp. A25]|eukprot:GSA25T00026704001.1